MTGSLGVGYALIFQPGIEFGEAVYARLGPEHYVAQVPHLVLNLALLPSRSGCASDRLDQVMRAHLQKATVILARLADENGTNSRLHVIVYAAATDAAIKRKSLVMGVEDHFLGLARVSTHKRHPTIRQPHMRRFNVQREALKDDLFMAPIELIGLPRCETHGHIGLSRTASLISTPALHKSMHAIMGAVITTPAKLLK